MSGEVIIRKEGRTGRITLNRPQALHAVTLTICEQVIDAVLAWERDDTALALIDHGEGRGFSAGGDIRWLYDKIKTDPAAAKRFFHVEYQMNHLLFTSPLPLISFMDGVVMGGGAGLALPCRFRVATENTRFAMPEAGIGLFPDVGGGWYLPRLPDGLGLHLALTGERLKGEDCVATGVATHFIESRKLAEVKAALINAPVEVEEILERFAPSSSPAHRERRGTHDAQRHGGGEGDVAQEEKTGDCGAVPPSPPPRAKGARVPFLSRSAGEDDRGEDTKSPLSLRVLRRQLAEGARAASFEEVMRMEYRIASRIIFEPDFSEGIRAYILDKDQKPRWSSTADADSFFAPLPPDEEWQPINRT